MKNYITVAKSINPPYHWFILSNEINEKHKDILDAYLKDNSVEIEDYSNFCKSWLNSDDFIKYYNENNKYRLKPKNNFKDYGFEADFEGEILIVKDDKYFGISKSTESDGWVANGWKKDGTCLNDYVSHLKPIKKEWYEGHDNIGKLISVNGTLHIFKEYDEDNKVVIYISLVNNLEYIIHASDCRPATKEEVITLLIKEE